MNQMGTITHKFFVCIYDKNPSPATMQRMMHHQPAAGIFHRGIRQCFTNHYAFLFDSPVNGRIDNDASGRSPTYIPAAG